MQLIFWLFFGKQCLGDAGHVIKFELLNSLAKQHTQLEILIYYTNKQLINIWYIRLKNNSVTYIQIIYTHIIFFNFSIF